MAVPACLPATLVETLLVQPLEQQAPHQNTHQLPTAARTLVVLAVAATLDQAAGLVAHLLAMATQAAPLAGVEVVLVE